MHFNNKYINLGDSEDLIKDKINYNFNQILSFAVGQEGLIGPKGATGIPGPSGKKGETGPTGNRATDWTRGTTFPSVTTQEFDLWIDDSSGVGDVYERGSTSGSWNYTGFSLYNSDYFDVYTSIIGPVGSNDKSATGFKSSLISNSTSLVISDTIFSSSNINPNNSKLLISTEDQITNPILSFVKSNGDTTISPSFRWRNTGPSSYLVLDIPGDLRISSLLDTTISSFDPTGAGGTGFFRSGGSILGNTSGDINWISPYRIIFQTPNSPFTLSSLNFGIDTSKIYSNRLTEISNNFSTISPVYSLASIPTSGSLYNYTGGINVNSDSSEYRVFDFTGMDGHSVLYGLPSGSLSSGNHKQTVFGASGGGGTGSTGAPYSYHVKRLNNISGTVSTIRFNTYSERNSNPLPTKQSKSNVVNLTDGSLWNSNLIVFTPTNSLTSDVYLYVPSSVNSTLDPLYYLGEGNEYRVYLNEEVSSPTNGIKGICYDYFYSSANNVFIRPVFIDLPSPCTYVDLFWASKGSNTNPNGRIFYKTCSGSSGFLDMTNYYTISGNSEPNPLSSPSA